jgi:prepilin-type N-terminal cleavage/methylation domain-containing protein
MTQRKGFTLVEIMIVVAIIALLAAIAIPSFMKSRQDSRRSACVNNLRLIDHAKQQLATASATMTDASVPTWTDLASYFKGGGTPICRDGGTYAINAISSNPTCDKSASPFLHVLTNDIK